MSKTFFLSDPLANIASTTEIHSDAQKVSASSSSSRRETFFVGNLKENALQVNLATFLLTKTGGIVANKFYENNNYLSDSVRNTLCESIIEAEILNSLEYK